MATLQIKLRDDDTVDTIDTDRLTPKAAALAHAVAATPLRARTDMLAEHTTTGERRTWRAWTHYPGESDVDPIDYLESEARKFPPDWRVLATPGYGEPVRDVGHDTLMTRSGVLDRLAAHGIRIASSTWGSYTARGHAPKPDRYVGRTPLWEAATIDHWAQNRPGPGARTDLNTSGD